jgi:hypothetical protein
MSQNCFMSRTPELGGVSPCPQHGTAHHSSVSSANCTVVHMGHRAWWRTQVGQCLMAAKGGQWSFLQPTLVPFLPCSLWESLLLAVWGLGGMHQTLCHAVQSEASQPLSVTWPMHRVASHLRKATRVHLRADPETRPAQRLSSSLPAFLKLDSSFPPWCCPVSSHRPIACFGHFLLPAAKDLWVG